MCFFLLNFVTPSHLATTIKLWLGAAYSANKARWIRAIEEEKRRELNELKERMNY